MCLLVKKLVRCVLLLPFSVLLFACCVLESRDVALWGGDSSVPEFTAARVLDENSVSMSFSRPVTVVSSEAVLDSGEACIAEAQDGAAEGEIAFVMDNPPGVGERFVISAVVEDEKGNTLSLAVPFLGYNPRVAKLQLNEVRTVYGKSTTKKSGVTFNSEFVEFVVLEDGNLSGIRLESYGYTGSRERNTAFTFPAVEVSAGELVVVHYRLLPEDADFTDETGENLALSSGHGASPNARDFWFDAGGKPFSHACAVLVRERSGGALTDALLWVDEDETTAPSFGWMLAAAKEACDAGVWSGEGAFPAVDASGTTKMRSLCRVPSAEAASAEVSSAENWYLCKTATPGEENSTEQYVPK